MQWKREHPNKSRWDTASLGKARCCLKHKIFRLHKLINPTFLPWSLFLWTTHTWWDLSIQISFQLEYQTLILTLIFSSHQSVITHRILPMTTGPAIMCNVVKDGFSKILLLFWAFVMRFAETAMVHTIPTRGLYGMFYIKKLHQENKLPRLHKKAPPLIVIT